jgi:hypothetical protein
LGQVEIFINRSAGLVRQFESNRPPRLLLPESSSIKGVSIRGHIIDGPRRHRNPQLAIDRQVEQSQVAHAALKLEFGSDRPDMARPKRGLWTDQLSFVPRLTLRGRIRCIRLGVAHGQSLC